MKLTPMFLSIIFLCSVAAQVTTIEKQADFKAKIGCKKPVVCKFFAPWCGPCKASGPVVKELSEDRKDIEFIEVSHEGQQDSKKLFEEYNIASFPTFVVFKDGKEVGSFAGFKQKDELAKAIDEIIKNPAAAKAKASKEQVERLDQEASLRPEDVKKFEALQNFMASLSSGNHDQIKKHITKESVNYVLESPMMDLNIIFLLIMNEVDRADELIDYALSLKPDLTKELNIGGKKQTLKKHLDEMATSLQKKLDLINKVGKKLSANSTNCKQDKTVKS
jgi:thioredoxin 1